MAKKANGHGSHLPIYKSYVFRDKDPAIDAMRSLVEKHYGKRLESWMLSDINAGGGPSVSCMRGWFFRTTQRPNNATLEAAGRSLGYERVWRRRGRNK